MKTTSLSRRTFLATAAATAAGCVTRTRASRKTSPNEKLDIAIIGCGGQGFSNLHNVSFENVVAICDVDTNQAARAYAEFPKAKRFNDHRKLFDNERLFDAVVVSTPDHTHAPASIQAMRLGKHCYCEKPLTRTIHEARMMAATAKEYKVATQMGTQGLARDRTRQGIEMLWASVLGDVRDVHVWTDRAPSHWPQGMDRPSDTPPAPNGLDWDTWLGTAPARPYHPAYHPFKWRGWCDFGTGALGDMGIHNAALAWLGLKLGTPTKIEFQSSPRFKETYPVWAEMTMSFPARGTQPPVTLFWYDGGKKPSPDLVGGRELDANGCIIVGSRGTLYSPDWAGDVHYFHPEDAFKDLQPPTPVLPRIESHHKEWIAACKDGPASLCNFVDFGAQITEVMLLGNLALLVGKNIEWDAKTMTAKNCPEAAPFITPTYRDGWQIKRLG